MSKIKAKTKQPAAKTTRDTRKSAPAPVDAEIGGKLGAMIGLLRRPEGTSLEALMKVTGWQKHSVRGALAGAIKKKIGHKVWSEKMASGERRYRLT